MRFSDSCRRFIILEIVACIDELDRNLEIISEFQCYFFIGFAVKEKIRNSPNASLDIE